MVPFTCHVDTSKIKRSNDPIGHRRSRAPRRRDDCPPLEFNSACRQPASADASATHPRLGGNPEYPTNSVTWQLPVLSAPLGDAAVHCCIVHCFVSCIALELVHASDTLGEKTASCFLGSLRDVPFFSWWLSSVRIRATACLRLMCMRVVASTLAVARTSASSATTTGEQRNGASVGEEGGGARARVTVACDRGPVRLLSMLLSGVA